MNTKEPKTFEEAALLVGKELAELVIVKQKGYGKGNILIFGEIGILVRASDKIQRLINLIWNTPKHAEDAARVESTDDTWKDLGGYSIVDIMYRRGWFELPLTGDSE